MKWLVIALALLALAFIAWSLPALFHSDWVEHSHLIQFSVPDQIRQVEVTSVNGVLVWSIVAPNPPTLSRVDYGVAPPGFIQLFPRQGAPRPLKSGELITITASFPPNGHMRIVTKALRPGRFLHGLTISGTGCSEPFCGELFQTHRLALPEPGNAGR